MKILLVAINAKYIHSNLAVYCLKSYAAKRGIEVELTEYTINHRRDDILMDIYQRKPDVVAFSCYIWNWQMTKELMVEVKKLLPQTDIFLGGPEVSYEAEKIMEQYGRVNSHHPVGDTFFQAGSSSLHNTLPVHRRFSLLPQG